MREHELPSRPCRVCSNQGTRLIDRIETPNCEDAVPVYHCGTCGHYSLFPEQYLRQKAFEWDGVSFYLRDIEQRSDSISQVLNRMEASYRKRNGTTASSLLDVGCAIGLSLQLAAHRGLRAVGVEPESRLAEYGRATYGVDIRHGMLQDIDLSGARFDLVYCEQVLEHVEDPGNFLLSLKNLLAPGGYLYIGVPPVFPFNRLTTSLIKARGARPWGLPIEDSALSNIFHDPDEHISVFTRRSMRFLADSCRMKLATLPLTPATMTGRRLLKRLLTIGASPGNYLLSIVKQP